MNQYASDIAFTPSVKAIQSSKGSRATYSRVEQGYGWQTDVTPELEAFISGLDMFYLGTANNAGQPYIQYRGGSEGFLKVVDSKTLGFADFGGNRQYITLGNLAENPKASLFLMDYTNSRRIKVWGTARVVEDDEELMNRLHDPQYPAKPEHVILFTIEAWDMNCHQHIHKRFSRNDILPLIEKLRAENQALQEKLAQYESRTES
ncbi:pyridoxamine 5'-phosphate oxidase family protein [uncultured Gimesia sp.]|uniref:pyridoxamine 5'-phosphate oxidase family protein n=1 Tax=uncultured Gimesia sp. TaxID=1678688 RepID=UPI0026398F91|nr:pyridoxamine 5'-phosphate oxidase family protein [uncultured Gimesia sp.]